MPKASKPNARTRPRVPHSRTSEEAMDVASQYGGRPGSAIKPCPFCKHYYLKPCSDKTKDDCPNFKHLQGRKKK